MSERYSVGLWKAIRKEWNYLNDRLAYQVGNGQRVRFRMDKWYGDEPLCESFPSLFTISMYKLGWWMFGTLMVMGVDGPSFLRGL